MDSGASLSASERRLLITKSEMIRDDFKGIDVVQLLQDFEEDRPTLKDTTVLLAMSIRFARQVDDGLPAIESGPDGIRIRVQSRH